MQRWLFLAECLLVLGFSCGCKQPAQEEIPTAFKVEGKVVTHRPDFKGGTIEFRHDTKPGVTSIGEVNPDGSFALYSMTAQHKVIGAQEGPHTVTFIPASREQNVQPVHLKKKIVVEPHDNFFNINLDE